MSTSCDGPFVRDVGDDHATHPRLEGADLDTLTLEDGRQVIFDPENPDAYLCGGALEVGFDGTS